MKATQHRLALIAVLAIGLFLFGCLETEGDSVVSQEDASKFVNDDLRAKYPDAEIRQIIEMKEIEGSWKVKARVTYNYSSTCPVRINVNYDYPAKGFVVTPPEYIIQKCEVCIDVISCVLGTPEEAIIASHTFGGTEDIKKYIDRHSDAIPDAKFYREYVDRSNSSKRFENIWIVKWFSEKTNFAEFVMISDKGKILNIWEAAREETI